MPDQDSAQTILSPVQADQAVKADAWQAFKDSANEREYGARLQNMNLPKDVKAQLWEAKRSKASSQISTDIPDAAMQAHQQMMSGKTTGVQSNTENFQRISSGLAIAPSPADQISASLGKYISSKDTAAQVAGNPDAVAGSFPRMAKTAIDYGRAASTPKGAALTVGLALANTNPYTAIPVDAALVAHGGFKAVANLPEAIQGNPDAVENSLLGGAEAVGGVAGLRGKAPAVSTAQTVLSRKIAGPLVRKPVGATMEDLRFGRSPQAGIADEGLVAASREGMLGKVQARSAQLTNAVDQTLQNHPNANTSINAEPIIDGGIDAAQTAMRKAGNKSAIARLEDLRSALKTEHGPIQGNPFQMNQLKRSIGDVASDIGAFKATDPSEASAAAAMADIYSRLRAEINDKIPEAQPLNERIANLLSAKTAIKRNIALETNKGMLSGLSLTNLPFKLLEKTTGSTPARSIAARALNARNTLKKP